VLRLELIAIHKTVVELGIIGMHVHARDTGNERDGLCEIGPDLFRRAGAAGVVARRHDPAAADPVLPFEADVVVRLPAVQRDRNAQRFLNRRICIDSKGSVLLLRQLVACVSHSYPLRLPVRYPAISVDENVRRERTTSREPFNRPPFSSPVLVNRSPLSVQ